MKMASTDHPQITGKVSAKTVISNSYNLEKTALQNVKSHGISVTDTGTEKVPTKMAQFTKNKTPPNETRQDGQQQGLETAEKSVAVSRANNNKLDAIEVKNRIVTAIITESSPVATSSELEVYAWMGVGKRTNLGLSGAAVDTGHVPLQKNKILLKQKEPAGGSSDESTAKGSTPKTRTSVLATLISDIKCIAESNKKKEKKQQDPNAALRWKTNKSSPAELTNDTLTTATITSISSIESLPQSASNEKMGVIKRATLQQARARAKSGNGFERRAPAPAPAPARTKSCEGFVERPKDGARTVHSKAYTAENAAAKQCHRELSSVDDAENRTLYNPFAAKKTNSKDSPLLFPPKTLRRSVVVEKKTVEIIDSSTGKVTLTTTTVTKSTGAGSTQTVTTTTTKIPAWRNLRGQIRLENNPLPPKNPEIVYSTTAAAAQQCQRELSYLYNVDKRKRPPARRKVKPTFDNAEKEHHAPRRVASNETLVVMQRVTRLRQALARSKSGDDFKRRAPSPARTKSCEGFLEQPKEGARTVHSKAYTLENAGQPRQSDLADSEHRNQPPLTPPFDDKASVATTTTTSRQSWPATVQQQAKTLPSASSPPRNNSVGGDDVDDDVDAICIEAIAA
jgi:hypothetical protein